MPVDARFPSEKTVAPLPAARSFVANLRKPSHILVAISGGSDSTGLLLALHQAMAEAGCGRLRLSAVTIDHALRVESAEEARQVAALCLDLGVPHVTRRWEGAKPASGLSDASRLARYRLIAEVADGIGADLVVTGHTIGDQRETVAMRAARNAGADNLGLSGMADAVLYDGRRWIMRPFLACERQAIRDYILSRSQSWVDDPSNENTGYERVRVRQALTGAAVHLDAEAAVKRRKLSENTADFLRGHVQVFHAVLAGIAADSVMPDRSEFRHALAALIATLGGRTYFPAASSMERVLRLLKTGENGRLTVGRVLLDRRRDGLYIFREQRNLPELSVGAHGQGLWDERFLVKNGSSVPIRVTAGRVDDAPRAEALFPSLPPAVAKPATAGLPQIAAAAPHAISLAGDVTITPRLAPFDLFLPRFDLELANAIAVLCGRAAYPQPPV
ncbi:tRNA lysidine(34) synthetase TilS [Agrobacterium sp. NPDC089420]|uniref:tRNA lysidine(34) synthetase TilS n=1 Tax=Agrobacterium sp. NPDC089420 TaxID=3363918 RepID=UPI00384AF435